MMWGGLRSMGPRFPGHSGPVLVVVAVAVDFAVLRLRKG
jgi:hypothetical protein